MCLLAAPVVGLLAASLAENPPGNGPGGMQVLLGVGVPAGLSFLVARRWAERTRLRASMWAVASVAATGIILLLLALYVSEVIQPA